MPIYTRIASHRLTNPLRCDASQISSKCVFKHAMSTHTHTAHVLSSDDNVGVSRAAAAAAAASRLTY